VVPERNGILDCARTVTLCRARGSDRGVVEHFWYGLAVGVIRTDDDLHPT
jgi:hypothetical protein